MKNMNSELIRDLFNKATFDQTRLVDGVYHPYIPLQYGGEPMRFSITEEQYQKFAELIIRECAAIVNDNNFAGSTLGDRPLFEHFGVE